MIELLVVISIMGIIAGLTMGVVHQIKRTEYVSVASAELGQIENALENYKAKYGVYPPSNSNPANDYAVNQSPAMFSPLYYELAGVTNNNKGSFVTLDGSASIPVNSVQAAFGVGGFINCAKSGDEGSQAQSFLPSLKPNRLASCGSDGVAITNLITTVRGPDSNYKPLGVADANPFRYVYPGTNNPTSYDLWIQLVISGKTNLICNWSKNPIINSPLP